MASYITADLRQLSCLLVLLLLAMPADAPYVSAAPRARNHYHIIKKVVLGGNGGWDYLKLDGAARRLYIARATRVLVVDADTYEQAGEIPNTRGVHCIDMAPKLSRGFVSDGDASTVTVFDRRTLKVVDVVSTTGEGPDALVYDPASQRVFTFNGRSGNSTVISARTDKVVGTIELGGRPEFAVSDGRGMIYNNLEDKSEELAINTHTLQIESRWPLAPCQHPSGLAIDRQNRRLFVGCHNQMMAILNADTGEVITTVPIGPGVDANRYDPGTHLAFSANGGDGTLTVVREVTPDKFVVLQNVSTERGARTMAVDLKTHRVVTVTARFGPMPSPMPGQRFRRPSIVPGTFTLIVLAP
jgi:DNA-binding beta-propeller fold protein YncE